MSTDDKLQKAFEQNLSPQGDDLDVKAYSQVFAALNKEPSFQLSPGFADRVMKKILELQRRDKRRDLWWLIIGFVLILIGFIWAIIFTGFNFDLGFLKAMSSYSGLFIFGVLFVLVLQWLDKKVVSNKESAL